MIKKRNMIAYRKKNRAKIKVDKKIQNIKLKDNNRKRKQRHPSSTITLKHQ